MKAARVFQLTALVLVVVSVVQVGWWILDQRDKAAENFLNEGSAEAG